MRHSAEILRGPRASCGVLLQLGFGVGPGGLKTWLNQSRGQTSLRPQLHLPWLLLGAAWDPQSHSQKPNPKGAARPWLPDPRHGPGARGCAGQVSVPGSSRCQLKGALSGCLSLAHELGHCQTHTCVSSTANTLGTLNRSLQSYCCNTLGFHCLTEELELGYSAGSSVKVSN